MNSAPVTLPWISSTTATGESAAAGQTGASRPRQTTIARFILGLFGARRFACCTRALDGFMDAKGWPGTPAERTDITLGSAGTTICMRLIASCGLLSRNTVGIVICTDFFLLAAPPGCRNLERESAAQRVARQSEQDVMAFGFALRRQVRLAVTLLAVCCVAGARAEDAQDPPEPAQQQPAAAPVPGQPPAGQKGGG